MAWRIKSHAEALPVKAGERQEIILNALLAHPAFNTNTLHQAGIYVANPTNLPLQVAFQFGVLIDRNLTMLPIEQCSLLLGCKTFHIPLLVHGNGPQFGLTVSNEGSDDVNFILTLAGATWTDLQF